ncbi:MAG: ATP-dependent DNA ligase, partial [Burkholderiales bacterium]
SILSALEAQYVVKILTGDLRIGLREGLVEEAIAKAFDVPFEQVREANMLLGDIGQTAALAARKELHRAELSIFRPIKCMLATPQPSAEAVWERFVGTTDADCGSVSAAPVTAYLEDKFDGIRAQLHRTEKRVEIFSRDLRRITSQFPELADQARNFQEELIIDGEIIACQEGRRLTFFDLQRRLGRKSDGEDLFARAAADVPVAFVVFDLLWLNGADFRPRPLLERKQALKRTLPGNRRIRYTGHLDSSADLWRLAVQMDLEGIVAKETTSIYTAGPSTRWLTIEADDVTERKRQRHPG